MFKDIQDCFTMQIFVFLPTLPLGSRLNLTYCLNKNNFTYQDTYNILCGILFQFFQPFRYIFKARPSRQVEYYQGSRCSFIISMRNRSKSLLSGSIPNLNFDLLILKGDCFCCELYPYRRFWFNAELISLKSRKKISFTHSRISIRI